MNSRRAFLARLPAAAYLLARAPHRLAQLSLEERIEAFVKEERRAGRIDPDERTSWLAYDLAADEPLATINADVPRQMASMVKLPVALAFLHRVHEGGFIYGPRSTRSIHRMLHDSDNASTNWAMRQLGGPRGVQRVIDAHYKHLFRHTRIVSYIPRGGAVYRNWASASDYCRFFSALWNDALPGSDELKRQLSAHAEWNHRGAGYRIYPRRPLPGDVQVYNKTGTTARLVGDAGVAVLSDERGTQYPYVMVGIVEKSRRASRYAAWAADRAQLIRDVAAMVRREMIERHAIIFPLCGDAQCFY